MSRELLFAYLIVSVNVFVFFFSGKTCKQPAVHKQSDVTVRCCTLICWEGGAVYLVVFYSFKFQRDVKHY